MRYFLTLVCLPLLAMTGCATAFNNELLAVTDASNYRNRVVITHYESDFYRLSIPEVKSSCFPLTDATPTNCTIPEKLVPGSAPLRMESFEFSMPDHRGYTAPEFKELLFMAISDVALLKGFSKFTVTTISDIHRCSSLPSMSSYGTVTGNTYSGTSNLINNAACSDLVTIHVLFFEDPSDLAKGVISNDAKGFYLHSELYRGALPTTLDMFSGSTSPGVSWTVPFKAWKTYFNAAGLSSELHKKYGATNTTPYHIVEHSEELKTQAAIDAAKPLNKFKLTQ